MKQYDKIAKTLSESDKRAVRMAIVCAIEGFAYLTLAAKFMRPVPPLRDTFGPRAARQHRAILHKAFTIFSRPICLGQRQGPGSGRKGMRKMDEKTALKKSIRKWESIAAGYGLDREAKNCALCQVFNECRDCPIYKHTGQRGCSGTPYKNWYIHQHTAHDDQPDCFGLQPLCAECRRIAQDEVDFLKSLLPDWDYHKENHKDFENDR